jgi:hypothetical protein
MKCKVPPVSNRRISEDESSLVICADLVACRRVTTPSTQRGDRDHLSVLCIVAPSVACRLSGSLISEKGDTVLFEDSSSWDLANVVGGRWANPKPICGCIYVYLRRHWCLGSIVTLCRAILCRYTAAAVIERVVLCSLFLRCRVLFSLWSQCHLYGINATLGEACQSVEAL